MKKFVTIILFLITASLTYSQKIRLDFHTGTMWDKGFSNFMFQKNTFAYTNSYNQVSIGTLASVKLSGPFSFACGYDFSYRSLEVNLFANNPVNSFTTSNIYEHSIPLLLEYKFERPSFAGKSIIARIGGGLEIFTPEYKVFGMYNEESVLTVNYKYGLFYTIYPPKNPIPFIQGYIGFSDQLFKNGAISIGFGYKLLLKKFTYEMYYYFNNSYSPVVEQTFALSKQVSEFSILASYSFGLGKKKSAEKTE